MYATNAHDIQDIMAIIATQALYSSNTGFADLNTLRRRRVQAPSGLSDLVRPSGGAPVSSDAAPARGPHETAGAAILPLDPSDELVRRYSRASRRRCSASWCSRSATRASRVASSRSRAARSSWRAVRRPSRADRWPSRAARLRSRPASAAPEWSGYEWAGEALSAIDSSGAVLRPTN